MSIIYTTVGTQPPKRRLLLFNPIQSLQAKESQSPWILSCVLWSYWASVFRSILRIRFADWSTEGPWFSSIVNEDCFQFDIWLKHNSIWIFPWVSWDDTPGVSTSPSIANQTSHLKIFKMWLVKCESPSLAWTWSDHWSQRQWFFRTCR